ncbi:MAG: hypothetical protein CVU13_01275 [Bacteroidetes bacterium HGW-Bacteroidetes-8]|jgi:PAS domain S-box-containing protein|nr:MAG: hypothetical protein CVU13_01275 [Bacteroidetes bacterium HGW-Bacteroidetes-8]
MKNESYKSIIHNAPFGYAHFEIVSDGDGAPLDYIFIEVNSLFERLTNSRAKDVIGRSFREVGAALGREELDKRVKDYGEIALNGASKVFEYQTPDGERILRTFAFSTERGFFTLFIEDITENKKSEKQLLDNQERYKTIFNFSPIGIVQIDPQSYIIDANQEFLNILGTTYNDLIGFNILRNVQDSQMIGTVSEAINGRTSYYEGAYESVTGRKKTYVKGSFAPQFNKEGKISGCIGIFEDVSEKHSAIEELTKAKEKAQESDRLKSAFLANMSHEIRTPMNGILGFLSILEDMDITGEERHFYFDIIKSSGERLLNTINDIIEISKIEAGQLPVTNSFINISEIMDFHFNFFRKQTKDKKINFILNETVRGEDALIDTDKYKIDGILINLIRNAIKFTSQGTIEIGNYTKGDKITFYIKDSGMGIPLNKQEAIFDRFVQADYDNSRPNEGSGLGLSIVKAYVDSLQGKIWVDSVVGEGSTFFFSIPYNPLKKRLLETDPGLTAD